GTSWLAACTAKSWSRAGCESAIPPSRSSSAFWTQRPRIAAMASVVHPDEVEPRREANAEVRTTFRPGNGCERLEQRVARFAPGRSHARTLAGQQEILYVVSGRGRLELNGEPHMLEPDTGVFIARDETYTIDADEELTVVSVVAPAVAGSAKG